MLRHSNVNELFNHATACTDNEMSLWSDLRLDGAPEPMWIVSACVKCERKLRKTQGDKQMRAGAQNAQELRRDCALTSTIDTLDQSA